MGRAKIWRQIGHYARDKFLRIGVRGPPYDHPCIKARLSRRANARMGSVDFQLRHRGYWKATGATRTTVSYEDRGILTLDSFSEPNISPELLVDQHGLGLFQYAVEAVGFTDVHAVQKQTLTDI